jgi:ferric-dicitrate binding protein FerR (iron transport regulator)
MDYAKFVELLKKQSKYQKLSEQEQKTLTEWKKSDPEVTDQLERIWQWSSRYETQFKPDTNKGLHQLRQRMAAEQPALAGRKVTRMRYVRWVAVAAILIGCALSLPFLLQPELPVYETAMGEVEEVSLPDGSLVVLNEGSTLQLSRAFVKGKKRSVVLQGEAFFDIQSRPEDPFTISTPQTEVEVLGTAFSLRAYPQEDSTVVAVNEGLVRFADQKEELMLEANTRGACYHPTAEMEKMEVRELPFPDWYLYRAQTFRGEPVEKLCEVLKERFRIEVTYSPEILSEDCSLITFSIKKNEALEDVLQRLRVNFKIKQTGPRQYQILEIRC